MNSDKINNSCLVLISALIGLVAWGSFEDGRIQAICFVLPILWSASTSRWVGGLILLSYGIAASRGLVSGGSVFFDNNLTGVLVWVAGGILFAVPGIICWHKNNKIRALLIPVLILLLIIPPFGIVGWANPVTSFGWLFPGWGWWGFLIGLLLMVSISMYKPLYSFFLTLIALVLISYIQPAYQVINDEWIGYQTSFKIRFYDEKNTDFMEEYRKNMTMQSMFDVDKTYHVYPETVAGWMNNSLLNEWENFLDDQDNTNHIAFVSGQLSTDKKNRYYSTVYAITPNNSQLIYRQRQPVPAGVWRPWSQKLSGIAQWLHEPGAVEYKNHRLAFFMCYETLLVWPILHSMLDNPDRLISINSTWWAPSSIYLSQKHSMQSWSKLFQIPLTEAHNR